jgi:hypothetical protein
MKMKVVAGFATLLAACEISLSACGSSTSAPVVNPPQATALQVGPTGGWVDWLSTLGYRSFQTVCQDVTTLNQDISSNGWGNLGVDGAVLSTAATAAQNESQPPTDTNDYDAMLVNAINAGNTAEHDAPTAYSMADFSNIAQAVSSMNTEIQSFSSALDTQGISRQQTGCLHP